MNKLVRKRSNNFGIRSGPHGTETFSEFLRNSHTVHHSKSSVPDGCMLSLGSTFSQMQTTELLLPSSENY